MIAFEELYIKRQGDRCTYCVFGYVLQFEYVLTVLEGFTD